MNTPNDDHVSSFFLRADAMAKQLRSRMRAASIGQAEVNKVFNLATRIFPILLWKIDAGEVELNARGVSLQALLTVNGLSTSALMGRDIPLVLRETIFPVLRLDTCESVALWWDKLAVPNYVAPWLSFLEGTNALVGMLTCDARK